jgi:hypothetical protein
MTRTRCIAAISDSVCPANCGNPEVPDCDSAQRWNPIRIGAGARMCERANAGVRALPRPDLPPTGNAPCPYQGPIAGDSIVRHDEFIALSDYFDPMNFSTPCSNAFRNPILVR